MDDQIKLERLRNLSNKVDEWVELEGSVLSNKTKQNKTHSVRSYPYVNTFFQKMDISGRFVVF